MYVKRCVPIKEVYERLIGTHAYSNGYQLCGEEIARLLGVSAVAIHKKIKKLKDDGLIVPSGKRGNSIYYSPTKRKPSWLTNTPDPVGVSPFKASKTQWSCPIIKMPSESQLKGWEKREMQNGVVQYLLQYPFMKPVEGSLMFHILGKYKFTISVDFTRVSLSEDDVVKNISYPPWLKDYVKMALLWVKKRYSIVLDVNDVYSTFPPHSETELRETDAKQYLETARVTIEFSDGHKIMLNRSNKKDNFETTFPPWLKEYIDLPSYRERFNKMESELIPKILNIEEKINRFLDILSQQQSMESKRMKESEEKGVYS